MGTFRNSICPRYSIYLCELLIRLYLKNVIWRPIKKNRQKPGLTFSDFCSFEKQPQTSQSHASQEGLIWGLISDWLSLPLNPIGWFFHLSACITTHSPHHIGNRNHNNLIPNNLSHSNHYRKTKCRNMLHCNDLYRNELLNWIPHNRHRNNFHNECRNHISFRCHNCKQHHNVKRYNFLQRGHYNHRRSYFLNRHQITSKVSSNVKPEHRSGISWAVHGCPHSGVCPRIPFQDLIFSGPGPLQNKSQHPQVQTKPVDEDKHIFMLETFGNFL